MNDTLAATLMFALFAVSAAMAVQSLRTGRASLGRGVEATRRDKPATYWLLVGLWCVSAGGALALGLSRLPG